MSRAPRRCPATARLLASGRALRYFDSVIATGERPTADPACYGWESALQIAQVHPCAPIVDEDDDQIDCTIIGLPIAGRAPARDLFHSIHDVTLPRTITP